MPNKDFDTNCSIMTSNTLKFFYGSFHGHSQLSIGEGSPSDCYGYAYHNNLDFLILSEHNSFLTTLDKWNKGVEQCHKFNKKREGFTSFFGLEANADGIGDLNIINSKTYFTGNITNPHLLLIWMLNNPDAFIIISNPLKSICLRDYDFMLNKIISSIEVTSGLHTRYLRRDKYFFKLLDKGWKLGAVNGLNDSSLNFGDTEKLTCIVSPKSSKEALIYAIRNRRTYSTESRSLKLYYFINDIFMGGILENYNELKFNIILEDKNYSIDRIEIISNGGEIVHVIKDIGLNKIKYIYNHLRKPSESWYVIKIYQETDKISISSPIFLK